MTVSEELRFYKLLSEKFPTKKDVVCEIVNLNAIMNLPKGTEHFVSDIHGENEHFFHVMTTASGVIRTKVKDLYGDELSGEEQTRLANLVYYPQLSLKFAKRDKKWYNENLIRLIEICKLTVGKYTRSKVRKALPEKYAYIIDELLNCDAQSINKKRYYNEIVESIIDLESADDFIIELAALIRGLIIDHLHIVGDIFDRGPRPDIVMETIVSYRSLDIQWGNHDIVWMGAMMGNEVCISVALANSLKYGHISFLEEGYGVSLRRLDHFAEKYYSGRNSVEKMYKAISVIRFKLEDASMIRNPQFNMSDNTRLDKIDFDDRAWRGYRIETEEFPTVNRENPCELTDEEAEVVENLRHSFLNSEKMQRHLRFLLDKGGIYRCYNGNLLYHGCIPLDEDGDFTKIRVSKRLLSGKSYLDYCERQIRNCYNRKVNSDFMWYMWCSSDSPLFGKKNMATFERMYISDKQAHIEEKQPYFNLQDSEEICDKILEEFGLDSEKGHIINGHIPVKFKYGESPIKANGKLILIDGGMSEFYRKETGIAGYTLTFNSYGLTLTTHSLFEDENDIVEKNLEIMSQKNIIEKASKRILVKDTDIGKKLSSDVKELKKLKYLYDMGIIPEANPNS